MSAPPKRPFALSPAKQALLERALGARGSRLADERIPRRASSGPTRLSHAQERLWFLDQLEPGRPLYNVHFAFRLEGELDAQALERSFDEVVRRHEALRTTFQTTDAGPIQVVHPSGLHSLARADLVTTPEHDRQAELLRLATEEAHRPFDLGAGPLLRAVLYRLGEREHVLLVVMHHIVTDGWSSGLFTRELSILYEAFRAGRPSPLPELSIQYPDYAEWQRNWLDGEVLAKQLAYWRAKLAGHLSDLDLPADRPRSASPIHRGATAALDIPRELHEGVRSLCRREEVTQFMLLFAAFAAWLQRLTGQEDIIVGAPIANRNRVEVEELIGFFVNTLVLRADCSGDPSFRELLRRVREMALEAFANQDLPLEALVEALQPRRVPGRSPFFQVLFAFQSGPKLEAVKLPGLKTGPLAFATETARLDLTFYLEDTAEELVVLVEYDTDLFDASTITRLLGHWRTLLEGIVADPARRLSELPMLTASERRRALVEWACAGPAERDERSVVALFEQQVERSPDAIALEFEGERLTYRELARRSRAIASRLCATGAGTDSVVGIAARRSPDLVSGILGILKAGAAYVPLDPDYPRERIATMIAESGMRLALADEEVMPGLVDSGLIVLGLRVVSGAPAAEPEVHLPRRELPDSLAYVIFTSGSTGRPKGVAMTHRALRNLVSWQLRDAPGAAATLQFASSSFDVSFQEIFATLCSGGRLVLVSEEVRRDPSELLRFIDSHSLERVFVPFVALQQLAAAAETADAVPAELREIVTAGEALRVTREIAGFLRRLPSCRLVNQYGPTESHVVSAFPLAGAPDAWPALPPIGRAIDGARLYVLDRRLEPVPPGVYGDLCIGGVALARGYLNRPDLTAERFLPDPHCPEPGGRMYRTGDVARTRADGALEFVGRSDDQVKVRGVRVEPAEVEAALARHPLVRDVVVVAPEDEAGQRRLVAFVVARDAPPADDLRRFARSVLPDALVPAAFVALDQLPLTPSGKVDRRALVARCDAPGEPAEGAVAPRTPTEECLTEIFAHVLRLERLGTHDDFFERGGHSLLATQIVSRVRKAFGVELPLRALFESPTVAGLAGRIDLLAGRADSSAVSSPKAPPIEPAPPGAERPLSFAQQRLWFLDQLQPGSAAYNLGVAVRLAGTLDVEALRRALEEVVRRHASLRTTFDARDGRPVQVIASETRLELEAEHVAEADLGRLAEEETQRPFDLAVGPLFRVRLARIAEGSGSVDHVLFLTMHHAVSDGWSMGILVRELSALYAAFLAGEASPLADLPIQYADFACWQRRWLAGGVLEQQLSYWRSALAGAPAVLDLPTDRPRPRVRTPRGESRSTTLPVSLAASVKALGRREGATLFMTLLAAFQALLGRLAGQTDVVVGTPIANRNRAEIEDLIGFFVNTLALRVDLAGDPSFRELLARVREAALAAFAHQDLPFERLVEALAPERDPSRSPIFQVFFNLVDPGTESLELPGLAVRGLRAEGPVDSKFDLTLYACDEEDGLHLEMVYARDLFDRDRIASMLEQLGHLLAQIVADPEERVGRHSLVTPAFRAVLPDPAEPLASRWLGSIPERVAAHARRAPERLALSDRGDSWTYRELDEWSSGLAAHLCAGGIGTGDVVAIYAHRRAALGCALLGIWKAGAAFVILDPAHPAARLAECLRLTRPKAWLQVDGAAAVPPALAAAVQEWVGERRLVVARDARFTGDPAPRPRVALGPDDVAYLAFTSGTTGSPRGIVGTHAPLSHFLDWHARAFELGEDERFSVLAGLSHDPLLRDVFTPLWLGASAHFPDEDDLDAPGGLARWMQARAITVAHLTPSMGERLALDAVDGSVPTLRLACFGGERLEGRDVAGLRRVAPAATCVNFYGATETPQAMGFHVTDGEGSGPVPLGRGIEGVLLLVVNSGCGLAGVGETGDIHVRTPYLARGYLGDDALTRERFLVNPFTGRAGDRVYASGDRGRYRRDGTVEFCGRLDGQVKLRGARIELGEIEGALARHPALRTAAVVLDETGGEPRLVAYVVPRAGPGPEPAELRRFVADALPAYMVPAAFVVLDALPLTPSGKLDRRALPAPGGSRPSDERHFVAPRDEVEAALARIFEEVLGRAPVGATDDFFELGGHSLLAVRVMAAVQRRLARGLPLVTLFQEPTVEGLALRVRSGDGGSAPSPLVCLRGGGAHPPLFLVHAAGGTVAGYHALAARLGDRPVHGLQAAGLAGEREPESDLTAMAARYLSAVLEVARGTPVHLAGWSLGGVIAFEMARQLVERGGELGALALFDTTAPGRSRWSDPRALEELALPDAYPDELGAEDRERLRRVLHANLRAVHGARPRSGRVPILLFRALDGSDAGTSAGDETLGWSALTSEPVVVRFVPGTHASLLEPPHVDALARELERCLVDSRLRDRA